MRTIKFFVLFLLFAVLLSSCSQFKQFQQMMGEDPDPPEGYEPVFISTQKPFNANEKAKRTLQLSRTDPYKSDKVRLYLHFVQSDTVFLTDAASPANRKYWCEVIDEVDGKTYHIKDFTIRQSTKSDREPQAIALVMDLSGSMGELRVKAVEKAAYNFISEMKASNDMVALIMYDDSVGIECSLTKDKNELLSRLKMDGLGTYGKQTATLDAISVGIDEVKKSPQNLERVIMVFTDGQDNHSTISKQQIIQKARQANAMICTIDYGYMIQEDFLEDIANQTNGTYNHIYLSKEFDMVFKDIYHRLNDFYILEYEPPTFGEHTVTVKLCLPNDEKEVQGTYNNVPYAGMTKLINVYFDTGKAILKPASKKAIDIVYNMLISTPSMVIELQGHTDSRGDAKKNQKLSERRANAVRDALIKRGIDPSRIKAKGYGETQPIADNNTAAGRAKNRRTVFVVISE
jgi:outer membrane protein OmpA-like peptidoglycan-associated protein/Mg-chelatase subunit ChlD